MKKRLELKQEPWASEARAFFKSHPILVINENGKIEFDYAVYVIIAKATGLRTLKKRFIKKRVKEVFMQAIQANA